MNTELSRCPGCCGAGITVADTVDGWCKYSQCNQCNGVGRVIGLPARAVEIARFLLAYNRLSYSEQQGVLIMADAIEDPEATQEARLVAWQTIEDVIEPEIVDGGTAGEL